MLAVPESIQQALWPRLGYDVVAAVRCIRADDIVQIEKKRARKLFILCCSQALL